MRYFRLISLLYVLVIVGSVHAKRIGYYFYFDSPDNHTYEDNNIKVYINNCDILVSNKTDKIIYVDKENSFAVCNDKHFNMFNNQITTAGTTYTYGVSTNLGSINSNLSGITIGGNSGTYNQTATVEKRIISIPPKVTARIWWFANPFQLMVNQGRIRDFNVNPAGFWDRSRYVEPSTGKYIKLTKGFVRTFDLNTSPIRLKVLIKYSLTEDMKSSKEVSTSENYLKAVVADSYKGLQNYTSDNLPYCRSFMADTDNYQCWFRYKEGKRIGSWTSYSLTLGGIIAGCGIIYLGISGNN